MLPFQRKRNGVHLGLAEHERTLIGDLARQLVDMLQGGDQKDPALSRLLPDAYSGDDEAAAEFRRLTADDLTEAKVRNAETIITTLGQDRKAVLTPEAEQAWLRSLTDIRLTLGSRLAVTGEGFRPSTDPQVLLMRDIYDWLGYVQEALVRAIDR
ncbi:hypothetical protein AX769_06670 [Frondihabitans sp. PAMC 28766]|uniref:DUF2017 domain-containing protein n=1 Tax=Frondihabitans sp. PAMC 28766 TaxID=1795630 RepID=UPI00078D0F4F|nr:DUF2017 domain-containing protein [Frondihabitans sp. PAMC 28766]AMM19897.1 hypothetical protein AX769_06670 [Frondihabitans sp. PAMC 28766]